MNNPFSDNRSILWNQWLTKIILLILVAFYVYSFNHIDLKQGVILLLVPVGIIITGYLFINPNKAFIVFFVYNYFAMGLSRYIPGVWGVLIDFFLIILLSSVFVNYFKDLRRLRGFNLELIIVSIIWFLYCLLQFFNPETDSLIAWLYVVRPISLYFLFTVPICFVLIKDFKKVDIIFKLWAAFSIFSFFKGWCQLNIGLDWAEQKWMNEVGYATHMIWSGMRVFSIFTDAGQYGASIGQSGVVFAIVALGKKGRERVFYIIAAILSIYGMFMSGTRGAIAVPAAGFLFFLILVKNWKLLIVGALVLFSAFFVLKYTHIGSGNAQIVRMRTAFDPNDASLQIRLENQEKLKSYMYPKPFGTGLGSTGFFGRQYYSHKHSAWIATDSWFVLIWVEMGIVGLIFHLMVLFYCLIRGSWIVMSQVRDKELYFMMSGLLCGFCGVIAASYGNAILGQMPTCILVSISIAFVFNSKVIQENLSKGSVLNNIRRK